MTPTPLVEAAARLTTAAEEFVRAFGALIIIVLLEWSRVRSSGSAASPTPEAAPAPIAEHHSVPRTAWTVEEFAESTGLNKHTVYRLIQSGEIRAIRVNKSYRIAETERVRWIEEQERRLAADLGIAER
jgi:excisionase family DNA binding protein